MARTILSIALGLILLTFTIQAQSDISRFQKEHSTKFNKKNLKTTQEMLVKSAENGSSQMVAARALRELEQVSSTQSHLILNQIVGMLAEGGGRIYGIWNRFLHTNFSVRLKTH
jgi:hypothetical protein